MDFKFEKLVSLRKAKNLTQTEVADKCSVTRSGYRDWENGKNVPKTNSFYALCQVLEIAPEVLSDDAKKFPDYFNKEYDRYKAGKADKLHIEDKIANYNAHTDDSSEAQPLSLSKLKLELDDIINSLTDPSKQKLAVKALKELIEKLKNLREI